MSYVTACLLCIPHIIRLRRSYHCDNNGDKVFAGLWNPMAWILY